MPTFQSGIRDTLSIRSEVLELILDRTFIAIYSRHGPNLQRHLGYQLNGQILVRYSGHPGVPCLLCTISLKNQ